MKLNQPKKGKKLSEREHAIKRPDMYIGKSTCQDTEVWMIEEILFEDEEGNEIKKPEKRIVKKIFENFNEGFSRIHIEVFSNMIDNKWESEKMGVKMTTIKVEFTEDSFRAENDGRWIPVELQEFEDIDPITKKLIIRNVYPVEVFFTELRTGTNYDDDEDRKTSGRNGIGAKTPIFFSTETQVTCYDPKNHKKMTLISRNNGADIEIVGPEKYLGKVGKTVIECKPDFDKFGIEKYNNDWFNYFKKHAYDMSMITGLKVYFNDNLVPVKNMKQYALSVLGKTTRYIDLSAQGCDVILAEREPTFVDNKISHLSFVNGIFTKDGGTHVHAWNNKLLGQVRDSLNKNIKAPKGLDEKKIPRFSIDFFANHFILFIRCEIDKPKFESQSKHELVEPKISLIKQDGKIDEKDLESMMKWNFIVAAQERWQHELDKVYEKAGKEPTKHQDAKVRLANWAGTGRKSKTRFYLTEGDSALSLIEAGCSFMNDGYNINGSFPIRGKMPNAMKKSAILMSLNKEVKAIISALNLKRGIDYTDNTNKATLTHAGLCLATDSDADGTHIAALILALLYHMYNSLFKSGYVSIHMFPKASKIVNGKKVFFYRESDFANVKGIKYYKGLGTFRNEDADEFFNNPKIITLIPTEDDKKWMNMALGNGESDQRKNWISQYIDRKLKGEVFIPVIEGDLEIPRFIKENLSVFFDEALYRAIPSMVDGLKEGQRKVLHSLLKNKIFMNALRTAGSRKVIELQGYTLGISEYHHGDSSLSLTYVNKATGYVGTNNIPWCFNDGQFGTRHGLKAAAARYIETALDPIVKTLINQKDLPICSYKKGEKKMIEPSWYPTLIPMLLVNGSGGISVGFANNVPCFEPLFLVKEIRKFLNGDDISENFTPWYRGFTGTIVKNGTTWQSSGVIEKSGNTYNITELPLAGRYAKTQSFKDFLWTWKKGKKFIKRINENHTINTVHFEIITDGKENDDDITLKSLHLQANLKFNMWLVDETGRPIKYDSIQTYLEDWCMHRLKIYKLRKKYWLRRLEFEMEVVQEKVRYINAILDEVIVLKNKTSEELIEILLENKFKLCNTKKFKWKTSEEDDNSEANEEVEFDDDEDEENTWNFNYITKMLLLSLTSNKVKALEKEADDKEKDYLELKQKKISDMWKEELDEFEIEYEKFLPIRNKSDGKKFAEKKGKSNKK